MLAAKDEDVETKGASERQSITPLLAAETRLLTNTLSVHRTFFTHVIRTDREQQQYNRALNVAALLCEVCDFACTPSVRVEELAVYDATNIDNRSHWPCAMIDAHCCRGPPTRRSV